MKAVISFEFDDFSTTTKKEITVDAEKVIETVDTEINQYLKDTNSDIYGVEDLCDGSYYQGSVEITVQIKCKDEYFSVSDFRDFVNNGFKHMDEPDVKPKKERDLNL